MSRKLEGIELTLVRGERCLFEGLSFALGPGAALLLEGENGSGKTSLLKAIAGMLDLESGEVLWGGQPIRAVRQEFCREVVWMAHRVGLKADLTLLENLRFESTLRPASMDKLDEVLERLALTRLRRLPLRSLSAGQQRRVALARMVLSAAELWLMDEPFTNLDRAGRDLVMDIVNEHLSTGGMCVMAAHQDVPLHAPTERIQLQ